ncbi:hypothetical protein FQN51_001450 [Onygenales sp. PD_10]|nr:hypothetical protein FQN51_001450 [Onygenales sp. PD_10]
MAGTMCPRANMGMSPGLQRVVSRRWLDIVMEPPATRAEWVSSTVPPGYATSALNNPEFINPGDNVSSVILQKAKLQMTKAGAVIAYTIYSFISGFRFNIAEAKRSGLPFIVAPIFPNSFFWLASYRFWIPLIKSLPRTWWERWLDLVTPDDVSRRRYRVFANESDTFFIVSSGARCLMTADAECIHQITTRQTDFPKPIEMYEVLRQFGENVISAEGAVWRMHRKVTSSAFNERNAALVFRESIRQAQSLVNTWTGRGDADGPTIYSVERDTLRLSLYIISYVGFGVRLSWPGEALPPGADAQALKYGSSQLPAGHKMSLMESTEVLMENIRLLLAVPKWILKLIPSDKTRKAVLAYEEYTKYMDEMLDEKIDEARKGDHAGEGMDFMGALVRAKHTSDEKKAGSGGGGSSVETSLTREDILGNAFVLLIAGHETIANTLHFAFLELAANPRAQRQLQREIDQLLGDSDPNTWEYDALMNPMMDSMIGAVMNETLRLIPALTKISKRVTPNQDQVVSLNGQKHVIPKGTLIGLASSSVQCNPRYWPARPSRVHLGKDDLEDFVPDRWFRTTEPEKNVNVETEEVSRTRQGSLNGTMFRPERGAYNPFGAGPRSCLGRRVAQVEVVATLAVVFQKYSIELAVDEWATDEEVSVLDKGEMARVYRRAQDKCRETIGRSWTIITLGFHGQYRVPVRLVPRGGERFVGWVDGDE